MSARSSGSPMSPRPLLALGLLDQLEFPGHSDLQSLHCLIRPSKSPWSPSHPKSPWSSGSTRSPWSYMIHSLLMSPRSPTSPRSLRSSMSSNPVWSQRSPRSPRSPQSPWSSTTPGLPGLPSIPGLLGLCCPLRLPRSFWFPRSP